MSDEQALQEGKPRNRLTRVTCIALVVNGVAHGLGTVGMVTGLDPHAAGQPNMARRAAVAGFAALVMSGYVAKQLSRIPSLIVLPFAFVLGNLLDTCYELATSRDPSYFGPGVFETTFLIVYSVYGLAWLRAPQETSPERGEDLQGSPARARPD